MATAWTSLCLSCRTALPDGHGCDVCGDGDVVSLHKPAERAQAVEAAWLAQQVIVVRPPSFGGRLAIMGGTGATLAGGVVATAYVGGVAGVLGMVLAAGLLMSPYIANELALRRGLDMPETETIRTPVGVDVRPGVPRRYSSHSGRVGRIEGSQDDGAARADLLELMLDDGAITLRIARSFGFSVALSDHRHIEVPAGHIRVVAPKRSMRPVGRQSVRQRVAAIDPQYRRLPESSHEHAIPHQRARSLQIRDDTNLTVSAERFYERPARSKGYRRGARMVLVPEGTVWLKLTE